jgi:K+/H+ antiporter YhaU regulatory subunit KhtT
MLLFRMNTVIPAKSTAILNIDIDNILFNEDEKDDEEFDDDNLLRNLSSITRRLSMSLESFELADKSLDDIYIQYLRILYANEIFGKQKINDF